MKTSTHEPWIERSIALLEQSAQSLDAVTLVRLNRARQAALAQRHGHGRGRVWAIGSGFAGATLALVMAFGMGQRTHAPPASTPDAFVHSVADSATLPADDPVDLYENLDFYVWLNAEQHGDD